MRRKEDVPGRPPPSQRLADTAPAVPAVAPLIPAVDPLAVDTAPAVDAAHAVDPVALADWIDAEPVPALRQYRDELAALDDGGQFHTEPVTDHLVSMIGALQDVGQALREEPALPDGLAEVLERCSADLRGAQELVEETRARVEQDAAPVRDAVRERVRETRAAERAARAH